MIEGRKQQPKLTPTLGNRTTTSKPIRIRVTVYTCPKLVSLHKPTNEYGACPFGLRSSDVMVNKTHIGPALTKLAIQYV